MSAPRLNQIVWFWKDGEGRGKQPEPAIVMVVHDESTVDLWVFCGHGAQRPETKVSIKDGGGLQVRYATLTYAPKEVEKTGESKKEAELKKK